MKVSAAEGKISNPNPKAKIVWTAMTSSAAPGFLLFLFSLLVKSLKDTFCLTLGEIRQIIVMWCYINQPV